MPIRWRLTLLNAVMIGVILLTLAGSFTWLWHEHRVDQVENTISTQAKEAKKALEEGEDLLGKDKDELIQATASGDVIIVLRNAQGEVLGQEPKPPEKPDFKTGAGEIDTPSGKKCSKAVSPPKTRRNAPPRAQITTSTPCGSSPIIHSMSCSSRRGIRRARLSKWSAPLRIVRI